MLFLKLLILEKKARVVFCDISKAFDHVWHEGLLISLKLLVYLEIFRSYLSDRRQRVVLPGAEFYPWSSSFSTFY